MPLGFDCGTYNLVCCTRDENGNFKHNREVNAFVEIKLDDRFVFNMMKQSGVPLIERGKVAYALGEAAVRMAYTMSALELKRPMREGCVNPKEKDAFEILNIMVHSLIEGVKQDKEILYYSTPANALNEETDADYHSKIMQAIFAAYESDSGFKVVANPINEGLSLVYAELESKAYTGMGISCLCPGVKVYTDKGIVNIEQVKEGDKVLTHKGRWRPVNRVISKEFKGLATNLTISGWSKDTNNYKFVDNHELYIHRNGRWQWIGCEKLVEGDIVGEPFEKEYSPSVTITSTKLAAQSLAQIIEEMNFENSKFIEKLFIKDSMCCGRISNITHEDFTGTVYDLQVEEDHSFSGPMLTIHNCGAGMVNVCFAIFGAPVFQFSLVNSGDWIDKMAAKATGETITFINQEKLKINLSEKPNDLVQRAIQTQYRIMIEKTVKGIKKGLLESGKKARTDGGVDIVIAGGTSMPEGFDILFREVVNEAELPIKINSIVRPKDPLYSVARGCLIAAENAVK